MNAQAPVLSVRHLKIGFAVGRTVLTAVDDISFDIRQGETFALLGESGCGKSATAQALMRLLPAAGRYLDGQIELAGHGDVLTLGDPQLRRVRGGQIAMIFQEPATSLNPVLTVGEQIGEVLAVQRNLRGDAARQEALSLLHQVGIPDPERRLTEYPFQFSGGMKQRVMIAIALAGEPRLLIADEPTTALDVTVQAQILDLLKSLQAQRGMAILLITHDLGVLARMAHRVGVMYAGQMVELADRETFFRAPRHPYARALFAALPESVPQGHRLLALPGQVPPLNALPPGCRFAARCPDVEAYCHQAPPPWGNERVRCWRTASLPPWTPPASMPGTPCDLPLRGTPPAGLPVLHVRDLRVLFPIRKGFLQRTVGHVRAVDGVNLELHRGRTLALVGESGCGKTTVGKAILQLLKPTGGSIRIKGLEWTGLPTRQLRYERRHIQMVFQDPFSSLNPRLRMGEILLEGLLAQKIHPSLETARPFLTRLLHQVGLNEDSLDRFPHEFSGGQRQRIAIARALALQPEILICDEPTSALDVSVQAQILNLLKDLQTELGLAYLFITHNFGVVNYLADEIAVMYLGRIVEYGPAQSILKTPQHPYTRILLAAIPTLEPVQSAAPPLAGELPSPAHPPPGCHFHPRCPLAQAICRTTPPPLAAVPLAHPRHQAACHQIKPA